jgi:Uma2 family endonuclease
VRSAGATGAKVSRISGFHNRPDPFSYGFDHARAPTLFTWRDGLAAVSHRKRGAGELLNRRGRRQTVTAMAQARERRLTLKEFENLPGDGYWRHELVRGMLVREPPPNDEHGWLSVRLGRFLDEFVESRGTGIVVSETGFVLWSDPPTVRGPDLSFVVKERVPGFPARAYIHGAPDLAVEILSPANRAAQIREKVRDYMESGARLVWVVDPYSRSVTVHRPGAETRALHAGDELDGADVLPGFRLHLARLFSR